MIDEIKHGKSPIVDYKHHGVSSTTQETISKPPHRLSPIITVKYTGNDFEPLNIPKAAGSIPTHDIHFFV